MLLQKRFLFALSIIFSVYYFTISARLIKPLKVNTSIIINLQPFDDIPKAQIMYVYNELKKMYPNVIINKSIPLPKLAYYNKRNRYKADSLIRYLAQLTPNGHVTMGLTSKDISTTKGEIPDYGIMGLAYQPGKSCVVSTFRLSKKEVLPIAS
jgi:archaemetzincin